MRPKSQLVGDRVQHATEIGLDIERTCDVAVQKIGDRRGGEQTAGDPSAGRTLHIEQRNDHWDHGDPEQRQTIGNIRNHYVTTAVAIACG
jgi:hypothetical protein